MKFERLTRLILILGVMPLMSQPANGQGIGEYGGLMGLPRNLPTGKSKSTLNKLYGSAANSTSNVSKGSSSVRKASASKYNGRKQVKNVVKLGQKAQADLVKARALAKEKKLDEATKLYESSLNIRLQYWKGRDKSIPEIYKELAEIYTTQGKLDKAEACLKGSIASYSRLHGPGSKHTAESLEKLGDIYDKQGEHWKSHDHYLQSYMLTERYKGKGSSEAMNLRLNMARKAKDLGKFKRSADFYQKALIVNNDKNILSRESLVKVLNDYASVLKELKLLDEAKKLENQAKALGAKEMSESKDKPVEQPSNN